MDPLTQGALGAAAAQSFSSNNRKFIWLSFIAGWLAGMAPDLDILIRSDSKPLLALEYHRHFTHSLFFIPFGAAVCALIFWTVSKQKFSFRHLYFFSFLGLGTHGLLDACTSYGTQLLWPFSNTRVAWDLISIIDPLYSLPLLAGTLLTLKTKRKVFAQLAIGFSFFYFSLCFVQRERAASLQMEMIKSRSHHSFELQSVKPSFANIWLWKSIYLFENKFYVDALWIFPFMESKFYEGESLQMFTPQSIEPQLPKGSVQSKDVELFSWFSSGYVRLHPKHEMVIGDLRYSILPNEISPLWGIQLDPNEPQAHVSFESFRDSSKERRQLFLKMLLGQEI